MALQLTHTTAVRNGIADYVTSQIQTGGGTAVIEIWSGTVASPTASLVSMNLAATSFGTSSGGVATAGAISTGTVGTAGTAGVFLLKNKAGTEIYRGSVGTSGCDINLSSVTFAVNDQISITALTYTAPT
jgi:hypothetical protein